MVKKRLDVMVFERGLAESREKARALIMSGIVYVNDVKIDKAGFSINEKDVVEVRGSNIPYVSRGGLKLEKALAKFDIKVEGKTCYDIGSSTGGFTDCMLQNGAVQVFSIDVGYGQLAYKLRNDKRVTVLEKTNFRYLEFEATGAIANLVSIDVSFISVTKLADNLKKFINEETDIIILIKPQFESTRDKIGKNGVISNKKDHIDIVKNFVADMNEHNYFVKNIDFSPIKGPKGNIEFVSLFKFCNSEVQSVDINEEIKCCVEEAHSLLNNSFEGEIQVES